MHTAIYPFTAIVGQEDMKLALILNVINPGLGGVLIKGEKGTAKSTAVRAIADLLPAMAVVKECPFHCDPADRNHWCEDCLTRQTPPPTQAVKMKVVELPVSATEDRVVGTLDIEYAIKHGEKKFEPGILAQANRNILYVDEINLLDDHVVDVLLDAAAMGVNTVEREGVSYSHPARFVLVGTMNPAEGELRPQLSDRIGLQISVQSIMDIEDRVKIMERREAFERDPHAFREEFKEYQDQILENIIEARTLLPQVQVSPEMMKVIAQLCVDMGVDGHRADIAILKTSKTLAAYYKHQEVEAIDVEEAAALVLGERFHKKSLDEEKIKKQIKNAVNEVSRDETGDDKKKSQTR